MLVTAVRVWGVGGGRAGNPDQIDPVGISKYSFIAPPHGVTWYLGSDREVWAISVIWTVLRGAPHPPDSTSSPWGNCVTLPLYAQLFHICTAPPRVHVKLQLQRQKYFVNFNAGSTCKAVLLSSFSSNTFSPLPHCVPNTIPTHLF